MSLSVTPSLNSRHTMIVLLIVPKHIGVTNLVTKDGKEVTLGCAGLVTY